MRGLKKCAHKSRVQVRDAFHEEVYEVYVWRAEVPVKKNPPAAARGCQAEFLDLGWLHPKHRNGSFDEVCAWRLRARLYPRHVRTCEARQGGQAGLAQPGMLPCSSKSVPERHAVPLGR